MKRINVNRAMKRVKNAAAHKAEPRINRIRENIRERIAVRRDKKWIEEAIAEGEALSKEKAASEKSYSEKWGLFTKKLRKIMDEYPTIPVVILPRPGMNADNVDCGVSYIYDDEGEFREKIITVYKNQTVPYGFYDEDDDSDIPF